MAASRKNRSIETHPLVRALNPDPKEPPTRTVKLLGLPGESPQPDTTRLWLDSDLTSYVDVPNSAIHYSTTLPDDGGTVLWVAADAKLTHGSATAETEAANFLSGGIAQRFLGAAAPTGGAPVPEGISLGAPCASPLCPSNQCPTHQIACNSVLCGSMACPTHQLTCSIVCPSLHRSCASHQTPCHTPLCPIPSSNFRCPTSPLICQISATTCPTNPIGCPSRTIVCHVSATCPSHQVIACPTGPVVCQFTSLLACPSRVCPSISVPCTSVQFCPSGFACGEPGGGGGIDQ